MSEKLSTIRRHSQTIPARRKKTLISTFRSRKPQNPSTFSTFSQRNNIFSSFSTRRISSLTKHQLSAEKFKLILLINESELCERKRQAGRKLLQLCLVFLDFSFAAFVIKAEMSEAKKGRKTVNKKFKEHLPPSLDSQRKQTPGVPYCLLNFNFPSREWLITSSQSIKMSAESVHA